MTQERRVVVTGIGLVTPLGATVESFWDALKAGRSGVGMIESFDATAFDCRIAAEIKQFSGAEFFRNPKDARRADRYSQFGVACAKLAVADAGLDMDALGDTRRFGVILGSGIGGLKTLEEQIAVLLAKGPGRVSPFLIPMMIGNMASGLVSMEFGLKGPNFSTVSACASACHAIGEAWRMIRYGEADAFLAGGSEATITQVGIAGFASMKAVSTRNDEPQRASRPFDKDRDGFVMGEGGGVVMLEELEHAKRRGARIYCEIAGYGLSSDAYHMTAPPPEGQGAAQCMASALEAAGVSPSEVDYINAHGTSTPVGDICEIRAIKSVFGEHAKNGLMISSTKSMTGHLLGAAGAVETAACICAIRDGIVPPTINLENPDDEFDLDLVPNVAREHPVRVAVNNSFGFGGHNASIVVRAFEG
jgi:3-oxoacyl-[acyl-carrier-protein] synthase II